MDIEISRTETNLWTEISTEDILAVAAFRETEFECQDE